MTYVPKCFSREFPFTKRFRKIPETSVGNELSVKDVFHLTHSSHSFPGSLHRPTKRPEIFLNCSAILSNTSFFVALLPNMCLCSAQVVISNRTSSSNHLSRLLLELVGKGSFETAAVKGWMTEDRTWPCLFTYTKFCFSMNTTYHLPGYWHTWHSCDVAMFLSQEPAHDTLNIRRKLRGKPTK